MLRLVVVKCNGRQSSKLDRLWLCLSLLWGFIAIKLHQLFVSYSEKRMSSLTVSKSKSKTVLLIPLTPAELDEQAQLAHDEALWQDRCDYYQSAR